MKNIKVRYLRQMVTKPDKKKIFIKGIIVCLLLYGIFVHSSYSKIYEGYRRVLFVSLYDVADKEAAAMNSFFQTYDGKVQNIDITDIVKAADLADYKVQISDEQYIYPVAGLVLRLSNLEEKELYNHFITKSFSQKIVAKKLKGEYEYKTIKDDNEGLETLILSDYSSEELTWREVGRDGEYYDLYLCYSVDGIFEDMGVTIIIFFAVVLLAMMAVTILICNRIYYKRKASYEIYTYRNAVINEISKGTRQQLNDIKENALLVLNTDDEDVVKEKAGEMMRGVENVNRQIIDALKKGKKYE